MVYCSGCGESVTLVPDEMGKPLIFCQACQHELDRTGRLNVKIGIVLEQMETMRTDQLSLEFRVAELERELFTYLRRKEVSGGPEGH